MNPAVAKLTPWLLEMMADSLEASGMTVTAVTVSAMDSWVQFFKNAPMGLIAFILLESSIFTKEYQSGTLVLALTKGLDRHKVVISKAIILTLFWTVCYWFCFTITFGYNTYFWDNSIAQNLFFSVICWWLFGSLVVALTVLFSTLSNSNTGVLAGTGCTVLVSYLIGLIPKAKEYLPTLIHEFNHSFINHFLDENKYPDNVKELEPAATELFKSSQWSMSKQAYGNWKTMINESLVRAAVICYMLDKEYKTEEIRNELSEQMQRNFRWMPELVSLLRKYEKKQSRYGNFENFYPNVTDFFKEYAKKENERFDRIK